MEHGFRKREAVKVSFKQPSRTVQDSRDECDVNFIMRKYERTGLLKHRQQELKYGDFSQVVSYHEAMNVVATANSMFYELPSSIREKFDNDPGKFLEFAENPKNEAAMVEMGLKNAPIVKPEEAPPAPSQEVPKTEPPKQ